MPNSFKLCLKGVLRMPDNWRAWTDDEIAKLKSMAGKLPITDIASELGRSRGATAVEASRLKISLRKRTAFEKPGQTDASLER